MPQSAGQTELASDGICCRGERASPQAGRVSPLGPWVPTPTGSPPGLPGCWPSHRGGSGSCHVCAVWPGSGGTAGSWVQRDELCGRGMGDRPGWLARFPTQQGMSSYRHLEIPCWVIMWVQIPRQSVMLSLNSFFHLIRKMSMVFIGPFDETRNHELSHHHTGVLSFKAAVPCPSRTQL